MKGTTGWSRSYRNAVQKWYHNQRPLKLMKVITKCPKFSGWSHRDIVRLCHIVPESEGKGNNSSNRYKQGTGVDTSENLIPNHLFIISQIPVINIRVNNYIIPITIKRTPLQGLSSLSMQIYLLL